MPRTAAVFLNVHRLGQYSIPPSDSKFLTREASAVALSAAILVVVAPGGFGKTTILADWCRERGLAWLGLRPENSDLRSLVIDVIGALGFRFSGAADALARLQSSLSATIDPALAAEGVAEAMVGSEDGWGIGIDDAQHVKDGTPAALFLERFVELAAVNRIPIGLAGRSIPRLRPVAKLRSSPNLVEIGAANLEFSADEVREVVQRMFGIDCSDSLAERLKELTQGWPALVVLAGKWLKSQPPEKYESEIGKLTGTDRSVYEYLATQILDDRPEIHRQFLLITSLIRRVPADLIEELLPDIGLEIVHDLEFGRFVTPSIDSKGTTYTFHPLLADFLESRALAELTTLSIDRVRRTAAEWFARHEIWSEAFRFWHLAGDEERIARQMHEWEQSFKEWWTDHGRWLEVIDESVVRKYPRLLLRHAMNSANLGAIDSALEWIERASRAAKEGASEDQLDVEVVRAIVLFFANFPSESMEICRRLEPTMNSMTPFQRSTLCTALVLLYNNDYIDPEQSLKYLEIYEDTVNRAGYLRGRFIATANRSVAARLIGDFEKQRGVLEQLRDSLPDGRVPLLYEGLIRFSEALAALELGLPSAQAEMGNAIAVLEAFGAKGQIQFGRHAAALLLAESGQTVRERITLGAASENHPYKEEAMVFGNLALAVEAALSGQSQRAVDLAGEAMASASSEYLRDLASLEAARIFGFMGDSDSVLTLAGKVRESRFRSISARAKVLLGSTGALSAAQLKELFNTLKQPHYKELLMHRERVFATQMLIQALAQGVEPEESASLLLDIEVMPLRIKTFGGLSVVSGNRPVSAEMWERPQAKALFAYLLLNGSKSVHAEVIIDAFWPDADEKSGRANFKTTCSRVRKAFEAAEISARLSTDEDDLVRMELPEDHWSDSSAIERLARLQNVAPDLKDRIEFGRRALNLAVGEFLPEYLYDDWAAQERERLYSMLRNVRVKLAEDLLSIQDYRAALDVANDIYANDPFDEDGVRISISSLKALDRAGDAIRLYREYCRRLDSELGLPPSKKLAELAGDNKR